MNNGSGAVSSEARTIKPARFVRLKRNQPAKKKRDGDNGRRLVRLVTILKPLTAA